MTSELKDKLIVKQQLEIEELKQRIVDYNECMIAINGLLFNIGAPLNDNILQFNNEQRKVLHKIARYLILEKEDE